uniref:Nematode transmission protein n=1 Tax=Tobacco rattle virus TaxID=12295 RepID=A0A0E3JT63_9VIRU|nr:nematode transmission protein [Tobacco rattle virus]
MHEFIRRWLDDANVLLLDNGSVVKVVNRIPHIRVYDVIGRFSVFDNSLGDSALFGGNIENVFTFMFRRFLCVNRDGHCYSRRYDELYYYGRVDLDSVSKITSGYEKSFIHRELYVLTDLVERVTKFFELTQDVVEASFEYAKVEERLSHVRDVLKLAGGLSTSTNIATKISNDVEQLLNKRGDVLKVVNNVLLNNGNDAIASENELIHAINQNLVSDKVISASALMKEVGFMQFPKHLSVLVGKVPKGVKYLDTLAPDLSWEQALSRRVSKDPTAYLKTLMAKADPRTVLEGLSMIGYMMYHGYVIIVGQSGQSTNDWASYRLTWSVSSDALLYTYPDASLAGPITYGWLI